MSASLIGLVASVSALALSLLALALAPSDYPKWWEAKPLREHCFRAESTLRGDKVRRCACGTHRGEAWRSVTADYREEWKP